MTKPFVAELIGTAFLLSAVVGSGIMAENLSGGNVGVALLANAIATGAMLYVLITVLGPVSGAHFNPLVTVAMMASRRIGTPAAVTYIVAQVAGAIVGVWLAHLMFDQTVFQLSAKQRWGTGQWISESIAVMGLLITIFGCLKYNAASIPAAVALYITSAYWFTASTSFANPAVTVARSFSNTFAGISPAHVLPFIAAQAAGTVMAIVLIRFLFEDSKS
jgi:glycerol uptake facilitator-like aquaporin